MAEHATGDAPKRDGIGGGVAAEDNQRLCCHAGETPTCFCRIWRLPPRRFEWFGLEPRFVRSSLHLVHDAGDTSSVVALQGLYHLALGALHSIGNMASDGDPDNGKCPHLAAVLADESERAGLLNRYSTVVKWSVHRSHEVVYPAKRRKASSTCSPVVRTFPPPDTHFSI